MKFDITRQPLIPSFLTLAALVVVTLVTADPTVTAPATAGEEAGGFLYVDSCQLRDRYALPSAFRAYRKWIL